MVVASMPAESGPIATREVAATAAGSLVVPQADPSSSSIAGSARIRLSLRAPVSNPQPANSDAAARTSGRSLPEARATDIAAGGAVAAPATIQLPHAFSDPLSGSLPARVDAGRAGPKTGVRAS